MKKVLIGLIMLGFLVSVVTAQAYRETNRFTGDTSIYSTKRRITLLRAKALYFAIYEKQVKELLEHPERALIWGCFQEWGHLRWRYLEYHDLVFLVDGKIITINKTEHDGDVDIFGNGKIGEKISFWISWTDFLKLLNADKVEYKLGVYERKLKSKVLKEMRSFRDEILKISKGYEDFISTKEVAKITGYHVASIRRFAKTGKLRMYRSGHESYMKFKRGGRDEKANYFFNDSFFVLFMHKH